MLTALSTAAKSTLWPLLTPEVRQHLSHLMDQYHGLQDKANTLTAVGHHTLYQKMASMEPVVKLMRQLEAKEKVGHRNPHHRNLVVWHITCRK